MHEIIQVKTTKREELVDITPQVKAIVQRSGIQNGLVNLYAQGATAAVMIQENWDDSVQTDVIALLGKLIPRGLWRHDAKDDNGDSHLESGLVRPSERIPLMDGEFGLSTWQTIFCCEFDGPRSIRRIVCTLLQDVDAQSD